jgi:O-antigen ligase
MFSTLQKHKTELVYLFVFFAAGILAKPLGYVVGLFLFFGFKKKNWYHMLLMGLWFALMISDNGKGLGFTKLLKPFLMIICFVIALQNKQLLSFKTSWYNFFIPLFFLVGVLWVFHPNPMESIQKSISIIFLFISVPILLLLAYKHQGIQFFQFLVAFVWLTLALSLLGRFLYPELFNYSGRFCGLFRNPNGMGVFVTLFFFLYRTIKDIFPTLFDTKDNWLITGVCFASIIFCGSRGALFSVLIFLVFNQFYKISPVIGFLVMIITLFLANYAISQLPVIVTALGLEEYLRLETLQDGSGRLVAWDFAMERIKESPYFGRGIGYTDWVFQDNMIELNLLGHQGNAHNSYLTYWIDTGIFGLISLLGGLIFVFVKASFQSRVALPICYAVMFMLNVESWLIASLNPFTIILVMMLTLLYHKKDILLNEEKKGAIALKETSNELEMSS